VDLDSAVQEILEKTMAIASFDLGTVFLFDETSGEAKVVAHRGFRDPQGAMRADKKEESGRQRFRTPIQEPIVEENLVAAGRMRTLREEGAQSAVTVPIRTEDENLGVLQLASRKPRKFQADELRLVKAIGTQTGFAIQKARLYQETQQRRLEAERLFEESQRLVEELKSTTQQLTKRNQELDTFVYTASHDLKGPLVALEGMAGLLAEEYGGMLDEQAKHYLKRLMAAARQMERITLDLLAVSRIGREGESAVAAPLNEIVKDLLLEGNETIQSRGIEILCHDLPTLWGARTQIRQVFFHLLTNAIKYLGENPSPRIEIGANNGSLDFVECYVRDNGIGIDPQYQKKIFELFHRLKEAEAEGTGVGLAIAKRIVGDVGGQIWVESAKGEGATFYFTWPKAKQPAET